MIFSGQQVFCAIFKKKNALGKKHVTTPGFCGNKSLRKVVHTEEMRYNRQ